MTREEWHAFVLHGTRTGSFAVPRKDGSPYVLPVWFVLDGDDFIFNTGAGTVRGKSLLRDGRGCMLVDEEVDPYSFVKAEGRCTVSEDLEEMRHWATIIGGRYMGADRAEEFGARNGVPGELLVRFTPERIFAAWGVAD